MKTEKAADDGAPGRPEGPRAPVLTASIIVVGLLAALGCWLLYGALTRTLTTPADPVELAALDTRLTEIENAAQPIAAAFASEPATGTVDIAAYRARVDVFRDLVDSTSDLPATSPDALEIRDLVLTGGSQVASGMNAALDAAASDEASATNAAAVTVDEGLANLDTARTRLDLLLGRLKPVQTG
jgi:hypothetical protein